MTARQEVLDPSDMDRTMRFLKGNKIELLSRQNRPPLLLSAKEGEKEIVLCFIPPEGTQRGDTYEMHHGMIYFSSPSNKERRPAESMQVLTQPQAKRVEERIDFPKKATPK